MASGKIIKNRIKSIKNTKKITKAMELVAASKMKRAVSSTLASRLYAEYSWEILLSIAKNMEEITHPLFEERGAKNILLVLITSNRGLCGAYNAQVIKKSITLLKKDDTNVDVVSIGKKGDAAMHRLGVKVVASFTELESGMTLLDIVPIAKMLLEEFSKKNYDKVLVAYTDFISALTQKPNIKQILPVSRTDLKDLIESLENTEQHKNAEIKIPQTPQKIDYLFEGDKEKLIGSLAEKLTRMQIYQMLLESNASEQSSRMMAMKNASEASGEMIEELTLVFNKARQSNITREISEISAGMTSVK